MRVYPDTSALVSLLVPDAREAMLFGWLRSARPRFVISNLARAEFASAVSIQLRTLKITRSEAVAFIAGLIGAARKIALPAVDLVTVHKGE